MTDAPRFSVTIPAYNAASTLARTVSSVQAQSVQDWEIVVVDDGSTDGTRELAEQIAAVDARVRVVSQQNRGSGGAYNAAVRAARADLLVMLSADDLLLPEHLAAMSALVELSPDAGVFTCNGYYEYEDGRRELADPQARWADPTRCTLAELLDACLFGVGATYRREVFDAVGGFREDIYAEDYLFWLLAFARGFAHRHEVRPLSVHRRTAQQKSAKALTMREADANAIDLLIHAGLLRSGDLVHAEHALTRTERAIRVRRLIYTALGAERGEALIARIREARR